MGDLTANFNRREFACKCRCGFDRIDRRVANMCQVIRSAMNEPITINSGCRCAKHNAAVGSTAQNHVNGNAADLSCRSGAKLLYNTIRALYDAGRLPDLEFCMLYETFVHIDCDRKRNNVFIGDAPVMPVIENDEIIWNYLNGKGLNDHAIAGLMGNLYAESGLRSNNLQNSYEKALGMTDEQYTALVDNGSYTNFVQDKAGYGLVQWTYSTRKLALLNHARITNKSIGDLYMQLDFMWMEIRMYPDVVKILKRSESVLDASNAVLFGYLKPADQSEAVQKRRADYGRGYYDKFVRTTSTAQETVINNAMEARIITDRAYWLGVLLGTIPAKAENIRALMEKACSIITNIKQKGEGLDVAKGYNDSAGTD